MADLIIFDFIDTFYYRKDLFHFQKLNVNYYTMVRQRLTRTIFGEGLFNILTESYD